MRMRMIASLLVKEQNIIVMLKKETISTRRTSENSQTRRDAREQAIETNAITEIRRRARAARRQPERLESRSKARILWAHCWAPYSKSREGLTFCSRLDGPLMTDWLHIYSGKCTDEQTELGRCLALLPLGISPGFRSIFVRRGRCGEDRTLPYVQRSGFSRLQTPTRVWAIGLRKPHGADISALNSSASQSRVYF